MLTDRYPQLKHPIDKKVYITHLPTARSAG